MVIPAIFISKSTGLNCILICCKSCSVMLLIKKVLKDTDLIHTYIAYICFPAATWVFNLRLIIIIIFKCSDTISWFMSFGEFLHLFVFLLQPPPVY